MVMPTARVQLEQQDKINRIVNGQESGHYYLLIGEKVTPRPPQVGTDSDFYTVSSGHRQNLNVAAVSHPHSQKLPPADR